MAESIFSGTFEFGYGETMGDFIGLTAGETYRIVWDAEEYISTATQATIMGYQAIVVGNLSLVGAGEDNDCPFVLGDLPGWGMGYFISENKEEFSTHSIAIYTMDEAGEEEPAFAPNDIILKRYSGDNRIFEGVNVVHLTHASGEGTVPFSYGEAIDNVPIALDFSEGDQTVTAPEGTLVKSAIIAVPENLVPENIPYGMYIAGVGPGTSRGNAEYVTVGNIEDGDDYTLNFSDEEQIVILPLSEDKLLGAVTIIRPAELKSENIREGATVAGIPGSYVGATPEFDFNDINLRYFTYRIDTTNKDIMLGSVYYAAISEATGSCDVSVPATIAGCNVTIQCT